MDVPESMRIAQRILQPLFSRQFIDVSPNSIEVRTEDRHISFHGYISHDTFLGDVPELEVSFGWQRGVHIDPEVISRKEPSSGTTTISNTRPDSLALAQKFREFLRGLSHYRIAVVYIAMGVRRERWYANVMRSCGYIEDFDGYWLPKSVLEEKRREQSRRYTTV